MRCYHRLSRIAYHIRSTRSSLQISRRHVILCSHHSARVKSSTTKGVADSLSALRYQRISPIEHILLRPDTYIGSTAVVEDMPRWIFDRVSKRMNRLYVSYPPGLLKIFDEILVNAADNKQRDHTMKEIRIIVDKKSGRISIYNDGKGLPIDIHPLERVYVPTLIFGYLYTSSNYDDNEIKVVGGRNGYGAKLCNIYSSEFVVETGCHQRGLSFKQVWSKNMSVCSDPIVEKSAVSSDYTRIIFRPDFPKFGIDSLNDIMCQLFYKRAIDVAGTLSEVDVYYNEEKLEVNSFRDYISYYLDNSSVVLYSNSGRRWQWAVTKSLTAFQHVSFVNNIATDSGGKHVDYIVERIVNIIKILVDSNLKLNKAVKPYLIKNRLFVFVNALIENPSFGNQTKDVLTTKAKDFGSAISIDAQAVEKWAFDSGLIDDIIQEMQQKEISAKTERQTDSLYDLTKLEDANWAGTTKSAKCSLFITEGDSAKALVIAGLDVIGRDCYGVFPIRGKPINVCEMSEEKAMKNKEISNLIRILGLRFGADYSNLEERNKLRYGNIIIFADQDEDGSHIKGLLINFLHRFWPELIREGFLQSFATPLLKARRGAEVQSFYSLTDFKKWKEECIDAEKFSIKYYKGLGTSTAKEGREYFSNMSKHLIKFKYGGVEDDESIRMVFSKDRAEDRKKWMQQNQENEETPNGLELTYKQFIDKELISFTYLDLKRSIPSMVDGLKPSQRKVLHTLIRMGKQKEIKVNQLAGATSLNQAYHHGEESLVNTIVHLAQDYVGSNNVPLLMAIGQFGTRHEGGTDAANARYIHTQLSPIARLQFPQADDPLLNYIHEENQLIEPEWYCPIVPLVLVNGAEGIATGWATRILNHDLRKVADNVRRMIDGSVLEPMIPSFTGFTGSINKVEENVFEVRGVASLLPDERKNSAYIRVEISELPIGVWTSCYKERVLSTLKHQGIISCFKEYHSERNVRFTIDLKRDMAKHYMKRQNTDLIKLFKLSSNVTVNSMVLFDENGRLKKYSSTAEILWDHFKTRKRKYEERKEYETRMLEAQKKIADNQVRFIESIMNGTIQLGRPRLEIENKLRSEGFEDDL